ncbi:MAG: DUF3089 domain-containing protein [Actinomycetales bacterium]|nr:DUF3089 domain-containing protein [Actinomycetales bacterium]
MSRLDAVPDGSVSSSDANNAATQLTVHGVALDVDTAELRALANTLARAAERIRGAMAFARRACGVLALTAPLAPTSGARATGHVWDALLAGAYALERAESLVASLERAAGDYEQAEQDAERRMARFMVPRPPSVPWAMLTPDYWLRLPGLLGLTALEGLRRGQRSPSDPQFGELVQELAWTITGGDEYPAFLPHADEPIQRLAGLVGLTATYGLGVSSRASVRQVDPPGVSPGAAPLAPTGPAASSVTDLVAGMYELYPRFGGAPGSIRVDRVIDPAGQVCWTVLLPGTQGLTFDGPNPNDWATNVQAFSGLDTAVETGVVQALRLAGAQQGQPIIMAGHSQGAMTAMRLANDPLVQAEFTVASVVTVGGPVGYIETPERVAVLNIEHLDDLTPGLENTANPVEYGRTTVIRDLTTSIDPADEAVTSLVQSHDIPAYVRTAEMVDASRDPAVLDWFARTRPALGADGATATSMYFQIEREG